MDEHKDYVDVKSDGDQDDMDSLICEFFYVVSKYISSLLLINLNDKLNKYR